VHHQKPNALIGALRLMQGFELVSATIDERVLLRILASRQQRGGDDPWPNFHLSS
jgi:hypothetical protein